MEVGLALALINQGGHTFCRIHARAAAGAAEQLPLNVGRRMRLPLFRTPRGNEP